MGCARSGLPYSYAWCNECMSAIKVKCVHIIVHNVNPIEEDGALRQYGDLVRGIGVMTLKIT